MRFIAIILCFTLLGCSVACGEELKIEGSENHPVILIPCEKGSLSQETWFIGKKTVIYPGQAKTLEIHPYNIDSTALKDEVAKFRYQYAILWTVLMGISFYLFINRNT